MNENQEIINRTGPGLGALARRLLFLSLLVVSIIYLESNYILWSLVGVVSLWQILFARSSRLVLYSDRLELQNRSLTGLNSELKVLPFKQTRYIEFTPSHVNYSDVFWFGKIWFFFPANSKITALTIDKEEVNWRWVGGQADAYSICKRATELIQTEYNQHEQITAHNNT